MIVRNRVTKKIYECSQKDASKIVGRSISSLRRWQYEQQLKSKYIGAYEVIFDTVTKIKQRKGFGLVKK